jgi:hypothetical protein
MGECGDWQLRVQASTASTHDVSGLRSEHQRLDEFGRLRNTACSNEAVLLFSIKQLGHELRRADEFEYQEYDGGW